MKKAAFAVILLSLAILASGCSNAQEKSVGGAVLGTILGGVIGHQSGEMEEGAVIGGAAGAVLGYMIGNEEDKKEIRRGGHYQMREKKVWVDGYTEKRWVPAVYETHIDSCGNSYQVLIRDGYYEYIDHPGHHESRRTKVWVSN